MKTTTNILFFLRAKTNRLMCYKPSEDHFKKSSSDKASEEYLANCLVMLSNKSFAFSSDGEEENKAKEMEINATFQCKSCKKIFGSHQALGGHRASHKRVKGCFASNSDIENIYQIQDSIQEVPMEKMHKMHECTICHRVFASGQALGGHKRCHWLVPVSSDNSFIPDLHDFGYDHDQQGYRASRDHLIDHDINLNLPSIPKLGQNDRAVVETIHEEHRVESMDGLNEEKSCTERKLRRMSELGDVKLDKWLQVGITSFSDIC